MPLRNRVTPFGEIVAAAARGTLMGNRGCLHEDDGKIVRPWATRRWIACQLAFKGRQRQLMQPRHYTELFFLDEATALANGHRPCAECRRADFLRFRDAWGRGNGIDPESLGVDDLDRALHADRVDGRAQRRFDAAPESQPDGTLVADGAQAFLVKGRNLLPWSPGGYGNPLPIRPGQAVTVLTPASILRAIAAGYAPALHYSAWVV